MAKKEDIERLQDTIDRLRKENEQLKVNEKATDKRLEQKEKRIEELEREKREWFEIEKNSDAYSNVKQFESLQKILENYKNLYENEVKSKKELRESFQKKIENMQEKIPNERGAGRKATSDDVIKRVKELKDLNSSKSLRELSQMLKAEGINISHNKIANILKNWHFGIKKKVAYYQPMAYNNSIKMYHEEKNYMVVFVMVREGYYSFRISPLIKEIADNFVLQKGVAASEFIEKSIVASMKAMDEELFESILQDTLEISTPRLKMILEGQNKKRDIEILIRLSNSITKQKTVLNGYETIKEHEKVCKARGYCWYWTNALSSGIGKDKREEFRAMIEKGNFPKVRFVISKQGGGNNELAYSAELHDFITDSKPISVNDNVGVPNCFDDGDSRINLKLENLRPEMLLSVDDFINSSGAPVKESFDGQTSFQYVTLNL